MAFKYFVAFACWPRLGTQGFGNCTISYFVGKIGCTWMPILWFDKGHFIPYRSILDSVPLLRGIKNIKYFVSLEHKWHKAGKDYRYLMSAFSMSGDTIWDPFAGYGTVSATCKELDRNYVASEIDPVIAEFARQRIINTQPPLFTLQPEQLQLTELK